MTEHDKNSPPLDGRNRAFELVSGQIDGDLSDAESTELACFEVSRPEDVADFRTQCQRLHAVLRQLPVQSVECSLWSLPSESAGKTGRSWFRSRVGVAWGSVAVVMAGCLLLAIVRPWDGLSLSDVQRSVASNDVPIPAKMAPRQDAAGEFASGADAVVMSEHHGDTAPSDSDFSIQPLLETTDWNIVVVQLDEKDRELAVERIQSIIRDHGHLLQNPPGDVKSNFVGVVLTSAVSENEELVTAMEKRVTDSPVEREQSHLAETRRKEIIEAVRSSLQHPTRSELHHGQVYVALSTGSQRGSSSANSKLASTAAKPSPNDAERSAAAGALGKLADRPISVAALTLVVFEFRSNEGDENGDSSEPSKVHGLGQPL